MNWRQRYSLGIRNLVFTLIVPAAGAVYAPIWILTRNGYPPHPVVWPASLVILAGIGLYVWCTWDFAGEGRGTPGPWDAPRQLVVVGPYRWVRNPIYISAALVIGGEALLYVSLPLLVYLLAAAVGVHLFVLFYEEPNLHRRFGQQYEDYQRTVPRWVPRRPQPLDPSIPPKRGLSEEGNRSGGGNRPPWWVSFFNPIAKPLLAAGMPMLFNRLVTIRGRKTGILRTTPLAVIEVGGRRWVWSPWGEVDWVRNLRVAGSATVKVKGHNVEVDATELDPVQRIAFFRDVIGPFARRVRPGVWLVRVVDGVDLDDPVEAAEGRPVFELHRRDIA